MKQTRKQSIAQSLKEGIESANDSSLGFVKNWCENEYSVSHEEGETLEQWKDVCFAARDEYLR